jgi:hypothetical protein
MDIDLKSTHYTEALPVAPVTVTVADVQKIAPAAVHVKEVNQIAPLWVESLRVDRVRHIDPLRIDRLNVTQLPTVNMTLSQLPTVDLSVQRLPPVAVALQQRLDMASHYTMQARFLGITVMRMELQGRTRLVPVDCARRERSRVHERSFPDVAAAGNPAIPSRAVETCTQAVTRTVAAPRPVRRREGLSAGAPRFEYSLESAGKAPPLAPSTGSSVGYGG